MKINISMRTRDGSAYAEGVFSEENTVVKAGGKVSSVFRGKEYIKAMRLNREYVDAEGNIIKDCIFSTPSAAAEFVNGNISNGFRVWKVNGENLGIYLDKEKQ